MKVSILLPISNNDSKYEYSINSILQQTHKNFELLICLNGNTAIFDRKIKKLYWKNKKIKFYTIREKNISSALNRLIYKASGDYCARMDADDLSKANRLREQINYIKKHKVDFLSSNSDLIKDNRELWFNHKTIIDKLTYTNPIIHSSIMIKTSIIKKYKYKKIPYAEDYELYLRLYSDDIKLSNIDKKLVKYRYNFPNINDYKKVFYLTLSTLIISKGFRSGNSVNESFFQKVKSEKYYKRRFKIYINNYLNSNLFFKSILSFFFILFGDIYIKKLIYNRLLYTLGLFKLPNIQKNIKKKNKKNLINPLVSYIIPTYNSHLTIYQTIKSIKLQTYKNLEIIVVDNSFDNRTIEIINSNFNDINIIKVKNKILSAEARNIGVKNISKRSHFICFCDSDDLIKPNKTEIQVNIMLKENLNASCTNADFLNQITKKTKKNYFKIPFNFINFEMLSYKNFITTSTVMLTKKIFDSVNGFSNYSFFYSFEDYFLWLKVSHKEPFRFIDQNLTTYRDDRGNSASSKSRHIINQRLRVIIFYLSKLELKICAILLWGNFLVLRSWIYRKIFKWRRDEYIDLL
jgi:glycosyltransferase involved in cell wall biosynthesis